VISTNSALAKSRGVFARLVPHSNTTDKDKELNFMSPSLTLGNVKRSGVRPNKSLDPNEVTSYADGLMRAKLLRVPPSALAADPAYSPRVKSWLRNQFLTRPMSDPELYQKATATAISSDDWSDTSTDDFTAFGNVWLNAPALVSGTQRIVAAGDFVSIPTRCRVEVLVSEPTASVVPELSPMPVMHSFATTLPVNPVKVACHVAVNDELVKLGGAMFHGMINTTMHKQVYKAIDTQVLATLGLGLGATASSGTTASAFLHDLELALQTLTIGDDAKLYAIVPQNVCRVLAFEHTSDGVMSFPGFSATRGGVIGGVTVIPSEATTDMYVIDASQIGFGPQVLELAQSNEALLQMSDSPSADVAETFSTWERNATALRALVYLTIARLRDTAVAVVSSVGVTA
jgi:hypothetical protein